MVNNTATNYYEKIKNKDKIVNPEYGKQHYFKLPSRMILVGASGSGKTNTLLNILERMPNTFVKVILCCKNVDEPLYNLLKQSLKDKLEIFTGNIPLTTSTGRTSKKTQPNVPLIKDIAEKDDQGYRPVLMVFDDLCLEENQQRIEDVFIRGRKLGITPLYLTQSYYKSPKAVRLNSNYIILKRNIQQRDLVCILKTSNLPIKINELVKMYRDATREMVNFLCLSPEDGKVYNTFDLQPIYSSFEDDEYEGDDEQLEITPLKIRTKNYKDQSLKDLGLKEYIKTLKKNHPNQIVPFKDLKDAYDEFCKSYNFECHTSQMLARELGKHFERSVYNRAPYYSL